MGISVRDIADRLVRLLSSLRLAVVLLIIMAGVSVLGTFIPQDQEPALYVARYGESGFSILRNLGIIDLYHSTGFEFLISLLTLNIGVCTYRRMKGVIRRTRHPRVERGPDEIRTLRIHNTLPDPASAKVLVRVLSDKGYRIAESGRNVYASKGGLGLWGDMVAHVSMLVVILGAFVGSLGYTATVNVYEDGYVDQVYNWNQGRDVPLGFRLYVDRVSEQYYPVKLRLAVRDRRTGADLGVYQTVEGGEFAVKGTNITIVPREVDFDRREADVKVFDGGRLIGLYDTGYADGGPLAPVGFGMVILLDGYGGRFTRSLAGAVRLQRGDRMLKQGIISVNNPMKYGGVKIYLTAINSDKDGRVYIGFQITRDPGVPLVWAGFGLLLAGLAVSFTVFHRRVWIYSGDDELVVGGTTNKDLQGFMREYGGMIKSYMQEVSE